MYNIAAARAVDREFKYNLGSQLATQGSGAAFKRDGVSAKPILAEFQLKRSHSDPVHGQNDGFV